MTIFLIAAGNLNNRYLRILGKIFKENATAKLYFVKINSESKTNRKNQIEENLSVTILARDVFMVVN